MSRRAVCSRSYIRKIQQQSRPAFDALEATDMAQHGTIYQQKHIVKDADGKPLLEANGKPTMKRRSANWWISYRDANGKRKWESAKSVKKGDAQRLLNLRLGATEKHEIVWPEIGRILFDDAAKAVIDE